MHSNTMNLLDRFSHTWGLVRASFQVIFQQPRLLLFPILSAACLFGAALIYFTPLAVAPTGEPITTSAHWKKVGEKYLGIQTDGVDRRGKQKTEYAPTATSMVYLGSWYFITMFGATFFNVAFFHEILAALRGQSIDIARGIRHAGARWQAILFWSLLAGVVGLIIKAIEERSGWLGRLVARFVGVAWSVAASFVIPILVQEEKSVNPIEAVKRSAQLLQRTWGEALIGYVGLSLGTTVLTIGSFLLLALVIAVSIALKSVVFGLILGAVWLIALIAASYLLSVAGQVFRGALYLYAAEGMVASPYSQDSFEGAWRQRKA